ncbi:hypothetical protein JB92DRAFT_3028149 [Gautieria morchelliformis]|nr:hypothetical protein JB92DRAFT_3028149 [Gautieria morchelliformis]
MYTARCKIHAVYTNIWFTCTVHPLHLLHVWYTWTVPPYASMVHAPRALSRRTVHSNHMPSPLSTCGSHAPSRRMHVWCPCTVLPYASTVRDHHPQNRTHEWGTGTDRPLCMHVRFVCTIRCTHVRCTCTLPTYGVLEPYAVSTLHVGFTSTVLPYARTVPVHRPAILRTGCPLCMHVRFVCTVRCMHVRRTRTVPPHARMVRVHHPLYARGQ